MKVNGRSVDSTSVALLDDLECQQLHTFKLTWGFQPSTHHLNAVQRFLEQGRKVALEKGTISLPYAGPEERRAITNMGLELVAK
ncbi:hypothetical protein PM082_015502 [Marasmius tenuissimus]|nr:hypothetical protein PM082_015502 [Marasmius tenuissimus]